MNKKYQILNSKSDDDCTIFYVLYIVLIFVVIFIIYKIIYNFTYSEGFNTFTNLDKYSQDYNKSFNSFENFENFQTLPQISVPVEQNNLKNIPNSEILAELMSKNQELNNIKNTIQDKLEKQSKAIYISQNYDKVDSSSFDDEIIFLLDDFSYTQFPEIDFDNKKIIETEAELNSILSETKNMKNFYQPGDIVNSNSTFGISKNDICYRHNGQPIKPTPEFIQKYPDCMVCSVESEQDVYDTNTWKNTRTNINKVCLYNPTAESNTGIPNLSDCQKFCGVKPTTTTTTTPSTPSTPSVNKTTSESQLNK